MLDPNVMGSPEPEDTDLLPDLEWQQPVHVRLAQDVGSILAALHLV
jgi:hypothetical protein